MVVLVSYRLILFMGQTFEGASANVQAAFSRMGAGILTPFTSALTPALGIIITLIDDITERLKFVSYAEDYEYNKLGVQRPDNVIFLTAPFDLVTKIRSKRVDNEGVENDIHERDIEFMKKVYENACMVAEYLNWNIIECSKNNEMRTVDDIHEDVYKLVRMK